MTAPTDQQLQTYLDDLRHTGNRTRSARNAGMITRTVLERRRLDEEFALAEDECMAEANDALEGEAYRRAHDGVEKPVFHQGKVVGYVLQYSDALLTTLLKANNPDKYADRSKSELTGAGGEALFSNIDDTTMAARMSSILAAARGRKEALLDDDPLLQ